MFRDSICTITWLHLDSVISNPLGKRGILDINGRNELIQVPICLVRDLKGRAHVPEFWNYTAVHVPPW